MRSNISRRIRASKRSKSVITTKPPEAKHTKSNQTASKPQTVLPKLQEPQVNFKPEIGIADSLPTRDAEIRRQEWLKTLTPGEDARMPSGGTSWYNYIMTGEKLPRDVKIIEIYSTPKPRTPKPRTPKPRTPPPLGGGGLRLLKDPNTGEEIWVKYSIGTLYTYGNKEADELYKNWEIIQDPSKVPKPPKPRPLPRFHTPRLRSPRLRYTRRRLGRLGRLQLKRFR